MITIVIHAKPHLIEEMETIDWIEVEEDEELPEPIPPVTRTQTRGRMTIIIERE
jgi:hypothetical protein